MRLIAAFMLLLISACANQTETLNFDGNKIVVKNGIELEKAKIIIGQFLAQENRWHIRGKITLELFPEKYRKACFESIYMKPSEREFCNAKYSIYHSSDPYCGGGADVLESCSNGECSYRISEYSEICE
jgi:hypothetical protein